MILILNIRYTKGEVYFYRVQKNTILIIKLKYLLNQKSDFDNNVQTKVNLIDS